MILLRFILLILLFSLIYKLAKNVVNFFTLPQNKTKENSRKKIQRFDPNQIEDIDYKEVKRKHD